MLILPTKKYTVELQPDAGKTVLKLEYKVTNAKRIKEATPEEITQMLFNIMRFEHALMDMKRRLMEQAKL